MMHGQKSIKLLLPYKCNKYYIFWVYVCSFSYQACNAHAPYCHLWPVWFHRVFPHYPINDMIFVGKKKVIEHKMCVLIFSTSLVRNISHFKNKWATYEYYQKLTHVFMYNNRHSCQFLMQLAFSAHIFYKYQITELHEHPPSESRVVP
jgi:hypothetical protein